MRRVKVLLINAHDDPPIWVGPTLEVFKGKHDIALCDESKPLAEQFNGVEVVVDIGGWGTDEMIDAATDAKLWQVLGTGLDHTNVKRIKDNGIPLANCPGFTSSVSLAELAMMFILMLNRRSQGARQVFDKQGLGDPPGRTLNTLTLGMVGFGASARDLALRAKPFGLRITAIDAIPITAEVQKEYELDFAGSPDDLEKLVAESDILSLHIPSTEENRHIIDARRIAMMKPTACLINVARGALVDEDALYDALLKGKLWGAGLDVFANEPTDPTLPVYKLPNVIVTPHVAGNTDDTMRKRRELALDNTNRLAEGLEPLHLID